MKYLSIVAICITMTSAGSMLAMENHGHRWSMECNGEDTRIEINRKISNLFSKCKKEHRQANLIRRDSIITNPRDPIVLKCKQKDLQQKMCHWAMQDFNTMMDQHQPYEEALHIILDNAAIGLIQTEPTFRNEFREALFKSFGTTN